MCIKNPAVNETISENDANIIHSQFKRVDQRVKQSNWPSGSVAVSVIRRRTEKCTNAVQVLYPNTTGRVRAY